jgi:hypothetical protein
MRILAALFLAATAAGGAQASSIVSIEPMRESIGPSTIVLGAPDGATVEEPGGPSVTFLSGSSRGPSIVVLGDPAATDEKVAATPPRAKPSGMRPMPMVIRGGLVGEVFVRQAPAGAAQAAAPGQPAALDPNDRGTPAKRKALKRSQQLLQEQASAPPAAPEPAAPPGE